MGKVSTHTDDNWKVATPRGEVIVFKRDIGVCNRMPYIDLREHTEGLVMLETVEKNMEMFTKKEIEKAQLARVVQRRCAHTTDEHLREIVSQQSLKNIPVSIPDIANAKSLLGTSVSGLKRWTTRKGVKGGFPVDRVSIPEEFYRLNKFVTIAADVMFVSGVPFFVTYSRKIKFLTVEYLPRRTSGQLANALCFYMHVGVL